MPVACTVAQRRPKPAITHHILNSSASGQHLACHLLLLPLRRLYFLLPPPPPPPPPPLLPVAGSFLSILIFLVFALDAGESSSLLQYCLCLSLVDLIIYTLLIEAFATLYLLTTESWERVVRTLWWRGRGHRGGVAKDPQGL